MDALVQSEVAEPQTAAEGEVTDLPQLGRCSEGLQSALEEGLGPDLLQLGLVSEDDLFQTLAFSERALPDNAQGVRERDGL